MRVCKQKDIAIVSGFHSKMERDVLKILLQGECGVIVVLVVVCTVNCQNNMKRLYHKTAS